MTHETITAVERAGMVVFATIVIVALPVIGLLNTLGGSMSGMIEYVDGDSTGYALAQSAVPEAAEITATPIVGPNTRAALLAFGLVIFALVALYRFVAISGTEPDSAPVAAGD